MIIKRFDYGWGSNFALKKFEQIIVDRMTDGLAKDSDRHVIINSVWYNQQVNDEVMSWLRINDFDHIVLVAMLDAAIPYPDRYVEFDCPVTAVGYYPGPCHVDFCAVFVNEFMQRVDIACLLDHDAITVPFMCLNRKPHWHRQRLYDQLKALDLLDRGLVSMGSAEGTALRTLPQDCEHDNLAPNASADHYGVPNDIVSLGHLDNWRRSFLNVVTETFWNINHTGFVSEKIYKPIVGCRPFLVYDPDGATEWLTSRGFEPFVNDFHDISDLDLCNPGNLAAFLVTLSDQSDTYLRSKFVELREKIIHNKQHFDVHVRTQYQTIDRGISCPI